MRAHIYIIVTAILGINFSIAQQVEATQEKIWDLETCISYALDHSITVKEATLTKNNAEVEYSASKSSRLPNLIGNANQNFTNGNSIDPITSDFVSQQINSTALGLNTQLTLYQGNQINNQIKQSKLLVDQNGFFEEQAKNDITLSILEQYIQLLYSKEAIKIAQNNLETSGKEEETAKARYKAGSIAIRDYMDAQSQTATNRYDVITAKNDYALQLVTLKQLLELPSGQPLEIADSIEFIFDKIPNLSEVYTKALDILPEINAGETNISLSNKQIAIAKGQYLPTLVFTGTIGTGYTSTQELDFSDQFDVNFNQRAGLSLSIPIFNRNRTKADVQIAKVNKDIAELQLTQEKKDLYLKIETAWQNANTAQNQLEASQVARSAALESYKLAQKQYELGALSTADLILSQNTYTNAEQNYVQAKYLNLLYTQLLEFYQGNKIKI
ncbi:TolC family protein [Flagellimonas sp. 389]|uniref:TolC family protein n=1 Tax=Flagellimonas sp. 389 TaxID=2835862 RepID=UPI001BD35237|nr:TolC family protein [Flagellimonas sp. 389]MBS9461927.1 TolC family protein [Flagellimonas sp. 389]